MSIKVNNVKKCLLSFFMGFIGLFLIEPSVSPSFATPFISKFNGISTMIESVKMPSYSQIRYRPGRVREILRERGYRKIKFIDRELPVYIVEACKNGKKFRIRLNRWARIRDRENLGSCRSRLDEDTPTQNNLDYDDNGGRWGGRPEQRLNPREVRQRLKSRGFRRIEFTDRTLPIYQATACKNNRKMKLQINGRGRIIERDRIGRCTHRGGNRNDRGGNRLRPREVRRLLKTRGFNRIRFTDRELPTYKAVACKHNRKMKLQINGRGRIIERNRIGRCNDRTDRREQPTLREIKDLLRHRGYHKIRYEDRELPRYKLLACRRGAEFDIVVNRWGDILRRKRSGWCRSFRDNNEPIAPALTFDDRELSDTTRIDADMCQNQLEYLIDKNKIYFTINSADIGQDSYSLLRKIAHVMKRCPSVRIEVAGHTDSVGSRYYNNDLSNRRAYSVARELSDLGISHNRLIPKGYGEDHPIVSNESNRGKAQNRRIDFIVAWQEADYADR